MLATNMTRVLYTKGERIVKKNEFVTHLVYVVDGYVKVHSSIKNRDVILDIFGPDTYAGMPAMISGEKHPFDITALDDAMVCLMDISLIRGFIVSNGLFAKAVVDSMNSQILHYANYSVMSLTQNNIHGRLANTLLYLANIVFGKQNFDLILSRKELAQLSNISRENVIKLLYEFHNDKLINLTGKQIQIISPENLKRLADFG